MSNIRIQRNKAMGKTRSEQEIQMRKEWGATMSDENLDKLQHLERKIKERHGSEENFISQVDIEEVK